MADDGIDTDNSRVIMYKNTVKGVYDDGIDIDNASHKLNLKELILSKIPSDKHIIAA